MKFFKLVDGILELDREEIGLYPNIKKILTRDKGGNVIGDPDGRKKLFAYKEFSYVYYMCDFYAYPTQSGMGKKEAHKWTLATIGLPSTYLPDEEVQALMLQYTKEHLTPTKQTIKNLINLFMMNNAILEKIEPAIKTLLNTPNLNVDQLNELIGLQNSLMKISTSIPEQSKKLKEAMTMLEEEERAVRIGRGGKEINDSQNPDNAIDRED